MTLRMTQIQIKHQEPWWLKSSSIQGRILIDCISGISLPEQLLVIFQGHVFVLQQVIFEVDASSRHTI